MFFVSEPKVYKVAETRINENELVQYLNDIGSPDWSINDDVTDAETLSEVMGRMCYRSWQPYDENKPECSNPNVSKVREGNAPYIQNVIKSKHGSIFEHSTVSFIIKDCSRVFCYTPDTEILTRNGWKNITDVNERDILLTKNPKTKKDEWQQNKKLHSFDYVGKVHYFENSQWRSPSVTPDHIMWCAKYDSRKNGKSCKEKIKKAEKMVYSEIKNKPIVVDNKIEMAEVKTFSGKIGNYKYTDEIFKWLGLIATDGTLSKNGKRCDITQTKESGKIIIRKLMNVLFGDRWNEYQNRHQTIFRIHDKDLWEWGVSHIGRTGKERNLSFLYDYEKKYLKSFYDGVMLGDGNRHSNGHEVIYSGYDIFSKDLQVIIARLGYSSNIRISEKRIGNEKIVNGGIIKNILPSYVVSVHKKGESLIKRNQHKSETYSGKVYCPETENGLVFVRNEGQAFWCGNTHELVRHRVGTAYSQESLRYVRLDDLRFWIPPSLSTKGTPEKKANRYVKRFLDTTEKLQAKLYRTFDIYDTPDFTTKKILTSMFRRFAPIGLATSIGFTANHRTLRHLIELRTSVHAEEEIRLIFDKIAKICKRDFPSIYHDMQRTQEGEWVFEHSKI